MLMDGRACKLPDREELVTLENIKGIRNQTGAEAQRRVTLIGRLKLPSLTVVSVFFCGRNGARTLSSIIFPAILALTIFALALTAQSPKVITDPAQITTREKFDIQPFSIDKLFSARVVGSSAWSPDGKQV